MNVLLTAEFCNPRNRYGFVPANLRSDRTLKFRRDNLCSHLRHLARFEIAGRRLQFVADEEAAPPSNDTSRVGAWDKAIRQTRETPGYQHRGRAPDSCGPRAVHIQNLGHAQRYVPQPVNRRLCQRNPRRRKLFSASETRHSA